MEVKRLLIFDATLKFAKTEVFRFVYGGFKILNQSFQKFNFNISEVIFIINLPFDTSNVVFLEVYLKLKCKRPNDIALPIAAFPFKNRVKKCTGLVIFSL